MLRRTYKYRIYPSKRQESLLTEQLGCTRELYNAALEQRLIAFRRTGGSPSYLEQSRQLTDLRRDCPELLPPAMSRSAQQFTLRRLDHAFQAFFRRAAEGQNPGFPRFKGESRWQTLQAQYRKGAIILDERERLLWQGVGSIRVRLHRPIPESAHRKAILLKRQGRHWGRQCYTAAESRRTPSALRPVEHAGQSTTRLRT
jgi:putative transposase